jgi:hypothetical protein
VKPESSLPHSQHPASCPCPEPDGSSPCPPPHFSNIHFNIILLSTSLCFPSGRNYAYADIFSDVRWSSWDVLFFSRYKGKGKVIPGHVVKAYRGSRVTTAFILNLRTRWGSAVIFTPLSFYTRERTRYPVNRRPNWLQSLSGRVREAENHLPLLAIETRIV